MFHDFLQKEDRRRFARRPTKKMLEGVMNYCILMANKLGVDMEEILLMKLEQNKKKYPVEKCKASSKKYTELIK